jgi:hypothetical protein
VSHLRNHCRCLLGGLIRSQRENPAMLIRHVEDRLSHHSTPAHEQLGVEHYKQLTAVVAEFLPDWSVEIHHDVLRQPTIIILPENLDDDGGPTLVVYGDETGFHLEELGWDTYCKLGDYHAWADLVRSVRIRLTWEMPFAMVVH